jgi:hypothetical protein
MHLPLDTKRCRDVGQTVLRPFVRSAENGTPKRSAGMVRTPVSLRAPDNPHLARAGTARFEAKKSGRRYAQSPIAVFGVPSNIQMAFILLRGCHVQNI